MTKEVNAGPVPRCYGMPDRRILKFRDGVYNLFTAFEWGKSAQGYDYWGDLACNLPKGNGWLPMYTDLPDEAKAIIDAWCEELEGQGND